LFCDNKSIPAALRQTLDAAFSLRVANWRDRLEQLHDKEQRVVAWGAGAKAPIFLNIVDPAGAIISDVVDINPGRRVALFPVPASKSLNRTA
jgi:hypothetical protein